MLTHRENEHIHTHMLPSLSISPLLSVRITISSRALWGVWDDMMKIPQHSNTFKTSRTPICPCAHGGAQLEYNTHKQVHTAPQRPSPVGGCADEHVRLGSSVSAHSRQGRVAQQSKAVRAAAWNVVLLRLDRIPATAMGNSSRFGDDPHVTACSVGVTLM